MTSPTPAGNHHHAPKINYRWGLNLRRWLRQPHIFSILDPMCERDAQFDTWDAGGCRLLACALYNVLERQAEAGTVTLKALASNECSVDHVVLKVETTSEGAWYLDGRGAAREVALLKRFAKEERRTGVRIIDYDDKLLDEYEIQCPPLKLARLIRELDRFITQEQ